VGLSLVNPMCCRSRITDLHSSQGEVVTARTEFDSLTGGPEMDIDWTFGDYSSLYMQRKGALVGFCFGSIFLNRNL
jgi:hypothetical protein